MGSEREVLQLEIDAAGMVSGKRVAVRELEDIKRAAGDAGAGIGRFESLMRGLGSRLSGFVLAASAAVGITLGLGSAFHQAVSGATEAERASAQLTATLNSTRGAAGVTRAEAERLATTYMHLTGVDDDLIVSAESVLLTFTNIGRQAFPQALEAALNLSAKFGGDLQSSILMVGKALNDPIGGLTALSRAGVQFSDSQQATIKALVETGRSAQAQTMILAELDRQLGGSARAARNTFGGALSELRGIIGNVFEEIGGRITPVLRDVVERLIATSDAWIDLGEKIGNVAAGAIMSGISGLQLLKSNIELVKAALLGLLAVRVVSQVEGWVASLRSFGTSLASVNPILAGIAVLFAGIAAYTDSLNRESEAFFNASAGANAYGVEIQRLRQLDPGKATAADVNSALEALKAERRLLEGAKRELEALEKSPKYQVSASRFQQRSLDPAYAQSLKEASDRVKDLELKSNLAGEAVARLGMATQTAAGDANAGGAAVGAYSAKVRDLISDLEREADQSDRLSFAAGSSAKAYENLKLRIAAENAVAAAGIDIHSKLGTELVELAQRTARTNDESEKFVATLKRMNDAAHEAGAGALQSLVSLLDRLRASAAAAAQLRAKDVLAGVSASGDLRFEVEWELKRVDALQKGSVAMREWAAAHAAAAFQREHPLARPEDVQAIYDLTLKLESLKDNWGAFSAQVTENFLRGTQDALAQFATDVLSRSGNALENFGKSIEKLLIQTISQYFAKWAIYEAKRFAESMAHIAAENSARAAGASASGGKGAGFGGDALSALNAGKGANAAGMSWGSIAGFAAVAAIVAYGIWSQKQTEKKQYETFISGSGGYGDFQAGAAGRYASKYQQAAQALEDLFAAIQQSTGAFIDAVPGIVIKIRNDGKSFVATVENVAIGSFSSANEAVVAAFKAAFDQTRFKGQIDPIIQQVVHNYSGKDPAELAGYIKTVQGIIDSVSGLTDIEIKLRGLPQQAAQMTAQLQQMGVSFQDASRLAAQFTVQQLQDIRDQITGHEKSRAEQLAEKQRQAALFNAQLALIRADLEAKKAQLEGHVHILDAEKKIDGEKLDIERDGLIERGGLVKAEGQILGQQLQLQGAYIQASSNLLAAGTDFVSQQIAAIDQILANLPKAIDLSEIHLPGTGGAGGREPKAPKGGGYGGPSKADQIKDFNAELESVARSLLPDAVARFKDLNDWLKRMTDEATRLGQPLDEVNRLYQEQLDLLKKQAQAEVKSKSANPFQAQLDAILEWRDSMIEVYTALGLDLTDIATATADQIAKLKGDVMASLGVAGAAFAQQVQAAADALTFLRDNMDLLGLSAEDLARITAEVSQHFLQGILEGLAQLTDNEEVKRKLEIAAYQIRIAELQAEIEVLYAMGFLAQDLYDWIKGIIAGLPELPPIAGDTGAGGGFTGGAGQRGQFGDKDIKSAIERLINAIDRLREFQQSLQQDESVSPLTLEQRFTAAQAHYQDILAQAQAGNVDAIEALPDVAQQYLQLAAQLYGTAGAGYGEIFQSVYDAVGAIVDNFDAEADRWQHLLDGQHDTNHILTQQSNLMQTANGLLQQIAGGGGGYPGAPPPQGIPGGIGEQVARVLQFPSGLQIIAQAGTSPPHAGGPPPPPPFPGIPDKKQRNPDFAIPGWGVGHLPSPTAHREVVAAIEKLHAGVTDELQDLRAENEALRKEMAGLRRDQRSATTATRDAITKGATGGGGGLVRLPMPSSANRRSA